MDSNAQLPANRRRSAQESFRPYFFLIGQRSRLERYLRQRDIDRYRALIQELGIREQKPQ
ncbi:MAG: hypothetical protein C4340_06985 [Armatimonadota bacterium]